MTQEFKTARAEQYADGKSSASVFRENHIKDYLAGYEQALEDTHAPEMLELLELSHSLMEDASKHYQSKRLYNVIVRIEELITKATTI